jgi:hypothetical protein
MNNPTTEQVLQVISEKSLNLIDREVNVNELNVTAQKLGKVNSLLFSPKVANSENQETINVSNSAMTQLLNRLQVPIIFYKRCSLPLQQSILDEFTKHSKELLLRCRTIDNDVPLCRAVLTSAFSRDKDDINVIPPALEALKADTTDLASFIWDEDCTHLIARFNDCKIEQGTQYLTASLSLVNSETGHSSIWIYPTITVNGYEYANRRGDISHQLKRIIHRGEFKSEEFKKIIEDTKNIAQVGIAQYLRAQDETVTGEHALDFVNTIEDFPKRFASLLEDAWKQEQAIRKVEVMHQVMQLVQELPLFQKLSVSRQVGRFIHLFENSEAETTNIVQELKS